MAEYVTYSDDMQATIRELVERGAHFAVSNSGGKDSQAMMIEIATGWGIPLGNIFSIHAKLGEDGTDEDGVEWPETVEHVDKICSYYNVPSLKTQAQDKQGERVTFFSMVRKSFRRLTKSGKIASASPWPSPAVRQCTSDLKRGPILRSIRKHMHDQGYRMGVTGRGALVVNCVGVRAQESESRAYGLLKKDEKAALKAKAKGKATAKQQSLVDSLTWLSDTVCLEMFWRKNTKLAAPTGVVREAYDWYPLFDWTTEDVFGLIEDQGQQPHWAYQKGMSRLSCVFCIMASGSDLRTAAQLRPELYQRYVALEEETGKTMSMSRESLPKITGISADGKIGLPVVDYRGREETPCAPW